MTQLANPSVIGDLRLDPQPGGPRLTALLETYQGRGDPHDFRQGVAGRAGLSAQSRPVLLIALEQLVRALDHRAHGEAVAQDRGNHGGVGNHLVPGLGDAQQVAGCQLGQQLIPGQAPRRLACAPAAARGAADDDQGNHQDHRQDRAHPSTQVPQASDLQVDALKMISR